MKILPLINIYANPTIDKIVFQWDSVVRCGGPGYYAGLGLRELGLNARLRVFGCHGGEKIVLEGYKEVKAELVEPPRQLASTTSFLLDYRTSERRMYLLNFCGPIGYVEEGDIAIVSPVYHEISNELLEYIYRVHSIVVIDGQGFARRTLSNGLVTSGDIDLDWFTKAVALKVSIEDVRQPLQLIKLALRRDINLVLTRGYEGVIVVHRGRIYMSRAVGPKAKDPTGLGDIFTTLLAIKVYENSNLLEAIATAIKGVGEYVCKCKLDEEPQLQQVSLGTLDKVLSNDRK
ncbi:MAG TPA: hypothetical protein EYH26_02820 [Pyrodictium sp.]|nr:hypothetical protein [Pyrodictium sp.]